MCVSCEVLDSFWIPALASAATEAWYLLGWCAAGTGRGLLPATNTLKAEQGVSLPDLEANAAPREGTGEGGEGRMLSLNPLKGTCRPFFLGTLQLANTCFQPPPDLASQNLQEPALFLFYYEWCFI